MGKKKLIIRERDVKPVHLPGRDVFNLVTSKNTGSKYLSVGTDIIFPKGKTTPPHYHPKSEEVVYVIQGKLKAYCYDRISMMSPGDAIFIKPGAVHSFENTGKKEAKIIFSFSPPVKTGNWVEVEMSSKKSKGTKNDV